MNGFQPNQNWSNYIASGTEWNDIYIGDNGILGSSSGYQNMQETVTSALLLWYGEYEYDTTIGLTYGAFLGNPNVDGAVIQYQVQQNILNVNNFLTTDQVASYGVKTINSITYALSRTTRKLTITCKITLNNNQKMTIAV